LSRSRIKSNHSDIHVHQHPTLKIKKKKSKRLYS